MKSLTPQSVSRVLIVEDNRDTADSTAVLLRMHGYDVIVAYDGRSALQAAKKYDPDVVLLDLNLPDIDGNLVAESLRHDGHVRPSLIAVSGHGWDDEARSNPYFSDHLVKPVTKDELVSMLAQVQVPKPCG